METYSVIRFYEDGNKEVIKEGLSIEEAKEHCQDESTQGINDEGIRFFDGFNQE